MFHRKRIKRLSKDIIVDAPPSSFREEVKLNRARNYEFGHQKRGKDHILRTVLQPKLVHGKQICYRQDLELVICVPVTRNGIAHRSLIRKTWGSPGSIPEKTKVVFIVGSGKASEDPNIQDLIDSESYVHQDMIQGRFIDAYLNLTLKSTLMTSWFSRHCAQAQFLMKADDDTYVNAPQTLKLLRQVSQAHPGTPRFMLGYLRVNTSRMLYKWAKWYVPKEEWPSYTLPDYEDGGRGYAMTQHAAAALARAAATAPFVRMEDVFLGVCARAADVTLYDDPHFPKRTKHTWAVARHVATIMATPEEVLQIHKDRMTGQFVRQSLSELLKKDLKLEKNKEPKRWGILFV